MPASGMRAIPGGKAKLSATDLQQMTISEFAAWLREQTNKLDRPFQEHTITSYTDAAKALDRWMTAQGIDDDFAACDTAMLNQFFAGYLKAHNQGGANTFPVAPTSENTAQDPCQAADRTSASPGRVSTDRADQV